MLQVLKSQFDQSMKSVRQLLQRPIKLEEGNLKLGNSKVTELQKARDQQRQRVRQMRIDLHVLLGQHKASRLLMRHLALVEHAISTKGLAGFDRVHPRIVAKALAELESVVWDWSPAGLADLRSRMAVIVKNYRAAPKPETAKIDKIDRPEPALSAEVVAFGPSLPAMISEVDHAEFEEMERSWVGFAPAAVAAELNAQRAA